MKPLWRNSRNSGCPIVCFELKFLWFLMILVTFNVLKNNLINMLDVAKKISRFNGKLLWKIILGCKKIEPILTGCCFFIKHYLLLNLCCVYVNIVQSFCDEWGTSTGPCLVYRHCWFFLGAGPCIWNDLLLELHLLLVNNQTGFYKLFL